MTDRAPAQIFADDLTIGQIFVGEARRIGDDQFRAFADMTGDDHPIHYDDAYAAKTRFGKRLAHGLLVMSMTALGATPMSRQIEDAMVAFVEEGARFLKPVGESFLSVAYVHLQPGFWSHPQAKDFLATLRESNPPPSLTSSKLVQVELEDLMTRESWRILFLALAAVSLLIYFDFRSWVLTFLSILPVVLACLWTLGIMGFLGIQLNFMNLVVFTMVLGIGVDYGVHVLHRGLQSSPGQLEQELQRVNKGVVLAGLTTLASFGSLVFSAYPGLQSMGAVALMGVGFSLFFALTLVPVLFQKWAQKRPLA